MASFSLSDALFGIREKLHRRTKCAKSRGVKQKALDSHLGSLFLLPSILSMIIETHVGVAPLARLRFA
eukprot:5643567-Pleurochrysis_carterae.AAC.1